MLNACTIFTPETPCYELFCMSSSTNYGVELLDMVVNFSAFSVFIESLIIAKSVALMNTGLEMLLDAIYLSVHNLVDPPLDLSAHQWHISVQSIPELVNFKPSWREDVDVERVVVIFSDEEPQSFLVPPLPASQVSSLINSIPSLKTYMFTNDSSWAQLVSDNGGASYPLLPNSMAMFANLMEIIDENACQ